MLPGVEKPSMQELPRIKERLSFMYIEHAIINRSEGAITLSDAHGTVHMPAAAIGVFILGPGTNITHRAMELLGDAGASVVWVGEQGIRYYAHGRPLTNSARLLINQAKAVSNVHARAAVAKAMYQMRFPGEDVSKMTIQQLRGREGSRIRSVYRRMSEETGVPWNGRDYRPDDFSDSDKVNMALSAANACLYGIAHAVIVAMGCSPGLGFIHTGHSKSFVYDVADLYKSEITIPVAFKIAALDADDVGPATRRAVRDAISGSNIMERMAQDIRNLLSREEEHDLDEIEMDMLALWDDKAGTVRSSKSYGADEEGDL